MSIHQTPDGRWFVAYRLKGDRAVKREYFPRGPEGKVAAKKWEADWLEARSARPGPAPTDHFTFYELSQRYLNSRPLSPQNRRNILLVLNLYVIPKWGNVEVSQLTMAHLAELDAELAALGRSMSTRNRYRSYCKIICQWGVNNDMAALNPFAKYRPETKKEGKAPDLMTEEELRAIYNASPPHLQWVIEVMMNTGVRPGRTELFAIKIADVDFARGGVWIGRSKTKSKQSLLPLRPEFLDKIRAMLDNEPSRRYLVEYEGRQIGSLKTTWANTLKRAGITRRLRPYDLRHWYASTLLSGGADIKAASELMGHSSPNTTLRTYYHLMERQKREALNHLTVPDLSAKKA
jgi:integrase